MTVLECVIYLYIVILLNTSDFNLTSGDFQTTLIIIFVLCAFCRVFINGSQSLSLYIITVVLF